MFWVLSNRLSRSRALSWSRISRRTRKECCRAKAARAAAARAAKEAKEAKAKSCPKVKEEKEPTKCLAREREVGPKIPDRFHP
jgi:RecB family exonuclease